MRIPFRALQVFPPSPLCLNLDCLPHVLHDGIIAKTPVVDTIGIEYAFDIQITQGFYLVLVSWGLARLLMSNFMPPKETNE